MVEALVHRQLEMSRRTAARINLLLAEHVRCGDVAREKIAVATEVRASLLEVPEHIPGVSQATRDAIRQAIAQALEVVIVSDDDRALAAVPLPPEPPAVVAPVSNLAGARAQQARLQARWISLKERIAR